MENPIFENWFKATESVRTQLMGGAITYQEYFNVCSMQCVQVQQSVEYLEHIHSQPEWPTDDSK